MNSEATGLEQNGWTDNMEANSVNTGSIANEALGDESKQMKVCRRVALVVGACLLCFVIVDAMTGKRLETASSRFVEWVALHPLMGILAVILVYITATICFVPGSALAIGTGYAFGRAFESTVMAVVLSTTAVFIGASLGSLSCLLLGRYLFREPVMRLAQSYPIFQAVDRGTFGQREYCRFQSHRHPRFRQHSKATDSKLCCFFVLVLLSLTMLWTT